MKPLRIFLILSLVAIGFSTARLGHAQPDTKAAEQAAGSWLSLVDAGKYPEAYKGFAQFFTDRMPLDKWEPQVKSARDIFGKFVSRKLKSATPATSLPGAPDGQYVVLQYDATFEKKQNAVETVTESLGKDGKWGVVGYYIK